VTDSVARQGWDIDLKDGLAAEAEFTKAVSLARVEHKMDEKAAKTGNIAIEIRQGSTERGAGKPSGICVTEAECWAQRVAPDKWLLIRTSLLKNIVRAVKGVRGSVMAGDGKRFENVLVPLEVAYAANWMTALRRWQHEHGKVRAA